MSAPPISAGEPASAGRNDLLPFGTLTCVAAEYLWEHFAVRGSNALNARQFAQSQSEWYMAGTLAEAFDPADPRRAASLAGQAVAGHAAGQLNATEAERALRAAAEAWLTARIWVDAILPELPGRSSMFHFRLERKHAGAYRELARLDYHRLLEAGGGACALHLALILHDRLPEEAKRLYQQAISARKIGLGARDLGYLVAMVNLRRLIHATGDSPSDDANLANEIAATTLRDPLSPLARWKTEMPARMTDRRRLLAAVYLSPVLIWH